MKKIIVFSVLLVLPAYVFGANFAQGFFDTHLNTRINRFDLVNEFKDWGIVSGKPMTQVFRETMTGSVPLNKMYGYFRGPVSNAYDIGIDTGCMEIAHAVACLKCNVDVIVDIFRKALIKRGMAFESARTNEPKPVLYPTDENIARNGKTQLDIESNVVEIKKQSVTMASRPDSTISENDLEKELMSLESKIKTGVSFHDRLYDAVKGIDASTTGKQMFRALAFKLAGTSQSDRIKTKKLIELNAELDEYIGAKVLRAKPPREYTWWERRLNNSYFAWAKEKGRKMIQKQRVNEQDRPWVIIALNVKGVITNELFKQMKHDKNVRPMIRYFHECKRTTKLALDLA